MYLFEAHYLDMEIKDDITEDNVSLVSQDDIMTIPIEIGEQLFESEKEIYLYAMSQAYDKIPSGYCFDNLEFIAC